MKKYIVQMLWSGTLSARYLISNTTFTVDGIFADFQCYSCEGHLLDAKTNGLFPWKELVLLELVEG